MPQTSPIRVADNVRAEIVRRRVRVADVATELGLSRSALHRRLAGEVGFDVDELVAIANLLEVPTSVLLGERGEVPA